MLGFLDSTVSTRGGGAAELRPRRPLCLRSRQTQWRSSGRRLPQVAAVESCPPPQKRSPLRLTCLAVHPLGRLLPAGAGRGRRLCAAARLPRDPSPGETRCRCRFPRRQFGGAMRTSVPAFSHVHGERQLSVQIASPGPRQMPASLMYCCQKKVNARRARCGAWQRTTSSCRCRSTSELVASSCIAISITVCTRHVKALDLQQHCCFG